MHDLSTARARPSRAAPSRLPFVGRARAAAPTPSRACACGGGCPRCGGGSAGLAQAEARARAEPSDARALPDAARETIATSGRPLEPATRARFEARHARDLSHLRLHTDGAAAASAAAVGANAYATGRHIAFGPGAWQPQTAAGEALLAHEIAHVAQGPQGAPGLARDEKKEAAALVPASALIGLPAGAKVVVTKSMGYVISKLVASNVPEVANSLNAIADKTGTLVIADDIRIDLRFDTPAVIPASGPDKPGMTISDLTLSLARDDAGAFDFSISGKVEQVDEAGKTVKVDTTLYAEQGLTAKAGSGAFVLSQGAKPHLKLSPAGSPTGQAKIEAFVPAYLEQAPDVVKDAAKAFNLDMVGLIDVQGLPSAPEGGKDTEDAAKAAIAKAAAKTAPPPRSTLTLGAGIGRNFGQGGVSPLLTGTYRYAIPSGSFGNLLNYPLQLDVMYAPSNQVIAALSGGVGSSLAALKVPVNVRVTAGLGAGAITTKPPAGSKDDAGSYAPVFGPTLGLGVGYEAKWFRVELRGDVLFNVLPGDSATVVPGGTLGLGGAF